MVLDPKLLTPYLQAIENKYAGGIATEHSHRPALQNLVEAAGVVATNEPRRIECDAPDFVVSQGVVTIGYIEAKDIGKSLDEAEKSEQLKRYRNSLTNLILTNYLEFRWYVDDEHTGKLGPFRKLKRFYYQSEWRLVSYDGPGETRKIWIGSIRDISIIIRSDEVNKKISF
jgi:hypothetical protein